MNMGVGNAGGDKKILDFAIDAMTQISGQKPVVTNARKSIANFRLRENADWVHGDHASPQDV